MNKSKTKKNNKSTRSSKRNNLSVSALRLKYRFFILVGVLVLAGVAILIKTESPAVWTFLYGIGGWAALTTHNIPKA